MSKPHRQSPRPRDRSKRRQRAPGGAQHQHPPVPLNADGVPVALADGPKASKVVTVSAESLARYPWLPARVIVGSIWRGPGHVRVRVDEHGVAVP